MTAPFTKLNTPHTSHPPSITTGPPVFSPYWSCKKRLGIMAALVKHRKKDINGEMPLLSS
jgi:hypothetical protein